MRIGRSGSEEEIGFIESIEIYVSTWVEKFFELLIILLTFSSL